MNAKLTIIGGNRKGEVFPIEQDRIVVGRESSASIKIADNKLSREHFCIEKKNGNFYLTDLKSTNKTYLNEKTIENVVLNNGDVIEAGETAFRFETESLKINFIKNDTSKIDIKKRITDDKAVLQTNELMTTLYKIVDVLQTEYNLDQLFNKIMQSIMQTINADRGFLIMPEPTTGAIMPVVSIGKISAGGISMSVVNNSLKDGSSVLSSDTFTDDRFKMGQSIITHNIRSVICVPVESKNKILGAIYLDTIGKTKNFTEAELELLSAIGKHAGIAIERAGLIKELEEMFHSAIRSMVSAIDAKDIYTKGHSERVTNYSIVVGKKMGFSDDELAILKLASILHDIGKIGIPDRILQKPGKLTQEEFEIIKEHPVKGAKIVENIKNTEKLILGIKHHHESWDGSGYPDGLKGEVIPKIAQIIKITDALDAMISDRPYRKKLPISTAKQELTRYAGLQFAPDVVNVLIDVLERDIKL